MMQLCIKQFKLQDDSIYKDIVFWFTVVLIEAIFLNIGALNRYLTIALTFCLVYLYAVKNEIVLVTCILVFANDALGQLVGIVSVKYLMVVFSFIEIARYNDKLVVRKRWIPIGLLGIYLISQPFLSGQDDLNMLINTLMPMLMLVLSYYRYSDKEAFIDKFTASATIIISLIAVHAVLTGGYTGGEITSTSGFVRMGILGVGSTGDANYSCLILCTGIVCALNQSSFPRYVKVICILVCCAAMVSTLSMAGMLSLVMVLVLNFTINRTLPKKIRNITYVFLAIILIVSLYFALPSALRLSSIDAYVDRVQEKILAFETGNMSIVTTGRSDLGDYYWDFINAQSLGKKLFGGNAVQQMSYLPHNSYIDYIIQFGYVGCFLMIMGICRSIYHSYTYRNKNNYRRTTLILKLLYGIFSASLSIYHSTTFSVMLFILFVI